MVNRIGLNRALALLKDHVADKLVVLVVLWRAHVGDLAVGRGVGQGQGKAEECGCDGDLHLGDIRWGIRSSGRINHYL